MTGESGTFVVGETRPPGRFHLGGPGVQVWKGCLRRRCLGNPTPLGRESAPVDNPTPLGRESAPVD